MQTVFEQWKEGSTGNFGSFQTDILKAYAIADIANMQRLQEAFPFWFVKEINLEKNQNSNRKSPHCCCNTGLVCALHPPYEYGSPF